MPVKYKLGDIIISNSPSKRKVLKVFSNSYVLSKPNELSIPDTKMLYTDDYIEWKGWHREEIVKVTFGPYQDLNEVMDKYYENIDKQQEQRYTEFLESRGYYVIKKLSDECGGGTGGSREWKNSNLTDPNAF